MLDWLKLGIGTAAGALVASSAVTLLAFTVWIPNAREDERQIARAASLQQSMDLIEQRSKTNAEIRNLDDAGLCRALGGMLVNGQCQ